MMYSSNRTSPKRKNRVRRRRSGGAGRGPEGQDPGHRQGGHLPVIPKVIPMDISMGKPHGKPMDFFFF